MDIINAKAQAYSERFCSPEDALLEEIAQFTYTHHAQPQMLSGHVQGKLLEMLSMMQKPARILEIGTFTGYSAICLSKGLGPAGKLHTIELRGEDADTASGYIQRSARAADIIIHRGNALDIIPELDEEWDLIFIDADKVNYINYYELTLPRVRKNGILIADNVLFHGQVLEDVISGKNAKAIHAFNEHIEQDNRVEKVMLTVRDGLLLMRKC